MQLSKHLLAISAMAALGSSAFAYTHVTGNITSSQNWTVANSPYILETQIFVKGAGTVLDIEPGVIIRGQPQSAAGAADAGSLIVRPEAKIQIRGTATSPVIFTTAALDDGLAAGGAANGIAKGTSVGDTRPDRWTPADGDTKYLDLNPATAPLPPRDPNGNKNTSYWGGLIVAGNSLTNSGKQVDINGDTVLNASDNGFGYIEGVTTGPDAIYGGGNSEHNGGIIKYVSLRHGGAELSTGKEINGLTLYAVGSKTTISYVDVYCTGDDGVEIFGGTVNLDHLNVNYADDDGFDTDEGWQGLAQFVYVLQGYGYGDNGLELDGEDKLEQDTTTFGAPAAVTPVGDQRVYNATLMLNASAYDATTNIGGSASGASTNGARMRAGFAGSIVNTILKNFAATATAQGYRIDGLKTTGLTSAESAEYENSARTYFGLGKLQLRNSTVHNFSTLYSGFTSNGITISTSGALSGTFTTGDYAGLTTASTLYPAALLRTLDTGIPAPAHATANGVDPRPSLAASSLAYGTTQDFAYLPTGAVYTAYKGAFDRTASTLWTTGWTALNKRGILKN